MTIADRWGVASAYEDFRGERRAIPEGSVHGVLEAMGADAAGPPPSPVRVARTGRRISAGGAVEIVAEDGGTEKLRDELPRDLAPGYHRLRYRDGSEKRLILAPRSCYLPRGLGAWGWAVQLYAIRSRSGWGIGDLGDLERVARWARTTGADLVMVNPLHAVPPGVPQQTSPYYPTSRVFRNPLYIDVTRAPGYTERAVRDEHRAAEDLRARPLIDRDGVYAAKMSALETLWRGAPEPRTFAAFRREQGDLLTRFATYMSIAEVHGPDRRAWPLELSHPDGSGVARWRSAHAPRIRFHEWLQWLIDMQLKEASDEIDVVHDLAIGVDLAGADAWTWQDVFADGVTIGAPPDDFNTRGQDWGLPPWDPWKLRAAGYEPFIRTVRAALRHAGGVRIDHVMGLFRLWWIPQGAAPSEGAYVAYPYRDLLAILALESRRAGAYVIGEDLGTVQPVVREEMRKHRMLSYRLLWFEEDITAVPRMSLAAVTSHDLPTVAGVWTGADLEEQLAIGLEPDLAAEEGLKRRLLSMSDEGAAVEDVIEDAYAALGEAPAAIRIATLEDAAAMLRRPNIPATTGEDRPNWSLPLALDLETLAAAELPARIAARLSARGGSRRGAPRRHAGDAAAQT